ncbi:hypothetical protein [Segetibacter sp. 3557_3]|uniref:hypothetical protein n=1 Tax=Segetibacter sp. 3557_3 TaxID=2547429 RepID=UPI00140427A9|nr:hypothetical protein [Segetibacter sp. 3557_3]
MYQLPTNIDPEVATELKKLQNEYVVGLQSDAPFAILKTIRLKIRLIISRSLLTPRPPYHNAHLTTGVK